MPFPFLKIFPIEYATTASLLEKQSLWLRNFVILDTEKSVFMKFLIKILFGFSFEDVQNA